MKNSALFLILLNLITAICSLAVFGGGIYVLVTFSEWSNTFGSLSVWLAMAAAIIAFLLSLAGCYGTIKESVMLLLAYLVGVLAVMGLAIAGLVFYNEVLNSLDQATSLGVVESSQQDFYNENLLSMYTYCCSGCAACDPVIPVPEVSDCTAGKCIEVSYCGPVNNGTCYPLDDDEAPDTKPPQVISETICSGLELLTTNGSAIVGSVDDGACGGGDPRAFTRSVYLWVSGNTTIIFSATIAFVVFIGLAGLATLFVLCNVRGEN